jgi:hypothetical protein
MRRLQTAQRRAPKTIILPDAWHANLAIQQIADGQPIWGRNAWGAFSGWLSAHSELFDKHSRINSWLTALHEGLNQLPDSTNFLMVKFERLKHSAAHPTGIENGLLRANFWVTGQADADPKFLFSAVFQTRLKLVKEDNQRYYKELIVEMNPLQGQGPTEENAVKKFSLPEGWLSLPDVAANWQNLFNESAYGDKVISHLNQLQAEHGALLMHFSEAADRTIQLLAIKSADVDAEIKKSVTLFRIETEAFDGSYSGYRATGVIVCDPEAIYGDPSPGTTTGPTEETPADTTEAISTSWMRVDHLDRSWQAYFHEREFGDVVINQLYSIEREQKIVMRVSLVPMADSHDNFLLVAIRAGQVKDPTPESVQEFCIMTTVKQGVRYATQVVDLTKRKERADPQPPGAALLKLVQVDQTKWFNVVEFAGEWPKIFGEVVLGGVVIQELRQHVHYPDILVRVVKTEQPHAYRVEAYSKLPDAVVAGTEQICQDPVASVKIYTKVEGGVERADRLETVAAFTPPKSAEDVIRESTEHAKKFQPINMKASDIRTADPKLFIAFVEYIKKAPITDQDRARLNAFQTFIQTCAEIENDLYYHCTTLGRTLDTMLRPRSQFDAGARRASFAAGGAPASDGWSGMGGWEPASRWNSPGAPVQSQRFAAPDPVNPQNASDIVISVYDSRGTLQGVFQSNLLPVPGKYKA